MHVSTHKLFLPIFASSAPAPKPNAEPTEFAEMAGVAEDLKIGGRRSRLAQGTRQRKPRDGEKESAASESAETCASMIAVSSPSTIASFDFTRLAGASADLDPASRDDSTKRPPQKHPGEEPSLDHLLSLVRSAE